MFVMSANTHMHTHTGPLPNGCLKQDCIVVPPPSNIMEKKKRQPFTPTISGQNRNLIKYKSK